MVNRNINQTVDLSFLSPVFPITKCYFKKHFFNAKHKNHTSKKHFHNFFELHLIENGYITYEINGHVYHVDGGKMLVIPPKVLHRLVDNSRDVVSYHLTFCFMDIPFDENGEVIFQEVNDSFITIIRLLEEKITDPMQNTVAVGGLAFSAISLLTVFQDAYGTKSTDENHIDVDRRLELAKQFIKDNVLNNPSAEDVAAYCNLSQKQLTRIFQSYENTTVKKYITIQRVEKMEELISRKDMTVKEIADKMSFNNEYYFNTFFKKYFGMTPGEYKKIVNR